MVRGLPIFLRVLVSFVLRVEASRAADGVLTGQVEDVASGDTAAMRGVPDLLAFVAGHVTSPQPEPERNSHA